MKQRENGKKQNGKMAKKKENKGGRSKNVFFCENCQNIFENKIVCMFGKLRA